MVSRMQIAYLKYDFQSGENKPERNYLQPQSWSLYLLLGSFYSMSYVSTAKLASEIIVYSQDVPKMDPHQVKCLIIESG